MRVHFTGIREGGNGGGRVKRAKAVIDKHRRQKNLDRVEFRELMDKLMKETEKIKEELKFRQSGRKS